MKHCLAWMLLWIAPPVLAAETIRLCQDEIEERPWRTHDNEGLNSIMLRMVGQQLQLNFQVENLPWKRCLTLVRQGEFDGAVAASFRQERLEFGAYPATADGQTPDRSRRMSGEAYYFYVRKDNALAWDGQRLTPPVLPIAVPMGYSAAGRLQEYGARIDERERQPEHLLRKVVLGVDAAAVLAQGEGDRLLADSRFAGKLVKHQPAFYQTDGYLLFSRTFVQHEAQLAERIWNSIANVRRSSAYQKELIRHGQAQHD